MCAGCEKRVDVLDETKGEDGFPGCWDARDGDQETHRGGDTDSMVRMSANGIVSNSLCLRVELVDDELGALDEDIVHANGQGIAAVLSLHPSSSMAQQIWIERRSSSESPVASQTNAELGNANPNTIKDMMFVSY